MTIVAARVAETLLEAALDYAIIGLDVDGLIISWSKGAHAIFGWTADEMIGRSASVLFTPDDRARGAPRAEMEAALAQGRANTERWHLRRDGTSFWASGDVMPLRAEAGQMHELIKIVRDRTAQRLIDERARADAEFLRSVLGSSGDCIKVLDLDGRVLFMNEGGQRVMEVSDFSAVRGCTWPEFWPSGGRADALAAVALARDGGVGKFQGAANTFAGKPKFWDVQVTPILGTDGRPEKLLAVSRDITAARQAEMALREAESLNLPFLQSSRDCIVVLDLDGRNLFVSPGGIAAMEVADVSAILGLSWLRIWSGEHAALAQAALAAARSGGQGRFQGFCATHRGAPKWWDVVVSPVPGADGQPERLVCVARDITEARQIQQRLLISEERLQLALGASEMVAIWDADLLANTLYGDANFARLHGMDASRAAGGAPLAEAFRHIHPDDAGAFQAQLRALVAGGDMLDVEHRLVQADGSWRWVVARGRLVRDAAGRPARLPGALVDVTERRRAEERQALLMEELAHRVKNTLAVVQSIAQQTLRGEGDIARARDALAARLVALGAAHDVLLQGSWTQAALRTLVSAAARLHAPDQSGDRFLIDGSDVTLGPRAALAFALVFHEMGTNAVKYGALSTQDGRVEVRWSLPDPGTLHLIWSEHDGPLVAPPVQRGFGSRLIERSLAGELGATVTLAYPICGVTLTVQAPLTALQVRDDAPP